MRAEVTGSSATPATAAEHRTAYWRRLREPASIVERDLELISRIPRTRPIVDVGCGNGSFVAACRERRIAAIGVEAFAPSAAVAAERGVPVLRAAGEELPIATASLDVVRLKEVLEHVQRPLDLASDLRRVLRPGGILLCYVPTQWSQLYPFPANFYDDYTHVRAFSRTGLGRVLIDAGFPRIKIEGCTPPLRAWQRPIGAALSRTLPFLWRAIAINGDARG